MKKIIYVLMILLIMIPLSFAGDEFEIPDEPLPVVNRAEIDQILIRFSSKQVTIRILKGFVEDGNFIPSRDKILLFADIKDDPISPEDETSTDFTDFMAAAKIDKVALKNFIKQRL